MTGLAQLRPAAPTAAPHAFRAAGAWCFGWFHHAAPGAPARGVAVVLCRPLGYEAMCSYPTFAQLAGTLAQAGFPALRFDYHGMGDSAGGCGEADRVEAWLDSIAAAVREAKALAGVSRVALVGVRLGATLAACAASRLGGVDSLVMWAPCPTGRAFLRELRAAGAAQGPDGGLEAMGYRYTAQTVQDLQQLDCTSLPAAPAPRALVIGRDDLPGEGPLPKAWRQQGIAATFATLPGYAGMMREPHEGVLEHGTLAAITDWLAEAPAVRATAAAKHEPQSTVECVTQGVRETPLRFGPSSSLFGILAEPAQRGGFDRRGQTAVLLLNVGGNYRIGPHRIYVEMARALAASGYRALRLDLAGIGDSPSPPGIPYANLYSKDSTADVSAAIDALALQGCKEFVLMGICSGSYVAFQTAVAEPRVHTQILMNSRLLEWQPGADGGGWQNSMQCYYKSTGFYLRALLRLQVWHRAVRGQVDGLGIARRFASVSKAWFGRAVQRLRGRGEEALLAKMKKVCARGTDTLMLIAEEDDGRDYVEFHFGHLGRAMRGHGNFRMTLVEDADHTFSRRASRQFVLAAVLSHLEARLPAGDGALAPGYNHGLAKAMPV